MMWINVLQTDVATNQRERVGEREIGGRGEGESALNSPMFYQLRCTIINMVSV